MNNFESNYCITLIVLLDSYLSEINMYILLWLYDITLLDSKPSILSSLLFLTLDELKSILEYYDLIGYTGIHLSMIIDRIVYDKYYCWK